MAEKHKVARAQDVVENRGIAVAVGGRPIALFRVGGKVYAMDNTCPHRGGPMSEGFLEGTRVACPWHGWSFDVCTGKHTMNPASSLATFPVSIEGEDVWITV